MIFNKKRGRLLKSWKKLELLAKTVLIGERLTYSLQNFHNFKKFSNSDNWGRYIHGCYSTYKEKPQKKSLKKIILNKNNYQWY